MTFKELPLTDLIYALDMAKAVESRARMERVEIEAEILKRAEIKQKEQGSATTQVGDYKLTVTHKVNRKIDPAAWEAVRDQMREDLRAAVKYSPKLDEKGVKYIQENEPEQYRILAQAITNTPAKPALKLVKNEG